MDELDAAVMTMARPVADREGHASALMAVDDVLSITSLRIGVVGSSTVLLRDVSLSVPRDSVVGLVGETGSGKTLIARSVIGQLHKNLRIEAGEIHFGGLDLLRIPRRRARSLYGKGLVYIPQNPFAALNPVMRLERQFQAMARTHTDWSREEARDSAVKGLISVGITAPERVLRGYPHELSGGMAQRVVIALTMMLEPAAVIADEPTTGLDLTVQRQVIETLISAATQKHSSVLLISHDLSLINASCSTVVIIYAGDIAEVGPTADVFATPLHPYTYGLLRSLPRVGQPVVQMQGNVPPPERRPIGCPFVERCEHRIPNLCEKVRPPVIRVDAARSVACHLRSVSPGERRENRANRTVPERPAGPPET